MSESNKKPIEEDADNLIVVNPDDYRQTRQIKQIHKLKEAYTKDKREGESKSRVYSTLQSLILELEPLMARLDTEGEYLKADICTIELTGEDFDYIQFSKEHDELVDTKEEAISWAKEKGWISTVTIDLEDVATRGYRYNGYDVKSKRTALDGTHRPGKVYQTTKELSSVDFDRAFRICRKFITEADLAARVEEDTGPARI